MRIHMSKRLVREARPPHPRWKLAEKVGQDGMVELEAPAEHVEAKQLVRLLADDHIEYEITTPTQASEDEFYLAYAAQMGITPLAVEEYATEEDAAYARFAAMTGVKQAATWPASTWGS